MQARVWYCVRQDIVALTEIPHVKGRRARLLYDAGLRTSEAIAQASRDTVVAILLKGAHACFHWHAASLLCYDADWLRHAAVLIIASSLVKSSHHLCHLAFPSSLVNSSSHHLCHLAFP